MRLSGPLDPAQRFSSAQRKEIVRRAGGRCEHYSRVSGKCQERRQLEADHVHPHRRGGWTDPRNGQALCPRHSAQDRLRIPYDWQLRALERRRQEYFPRDVPVTVIRRARDAPVAACVRPQSLGPGSEAQRQASSGP